MLSCNSDTSHLIYATNIGGKFKIKMAPESAIRKAKCKRLMLVALIAVIWLDYFFVFYLIDQRWIDHFHFEENQELMLNNQITILLCGRYTELVPVPDFCCLPHVYSPNQKWFSKNATDF